MFHVFLDTNIVVSDFQFNSMPSRKILKYSRRNDIHLCLTDINYHEVIKKFNDKLIPAINNIKKGISEIAKISGKSPDNEDITEMSNEIRKNYKDFLDKVINENNIDVIEHSDSITNKLLDRYFSMKKPFSPKRNSFQDALIWETIIEYYHNNFSTDEDAIFLISDNIKDFAEDDKELTLHHDLSNDIPELALYRNIKTFFEKENDNLEDYLIDTFELDENKFIEIIKHYLEYSNKVQDEIESSLLDGQFEGEYFEGWGEDAYCDLQDISIEDYSRDIESNEIEINATIEYHVGFSIVTVNPGYERDEPADEEYWTDQTGEQDFSASCNIIIDADEGKVIAFSVEELQLV
ncbi:PIN domain-containing protein [Sporolactobacillus terrae]|uniref:DUF4935 domain-containing protein n=1 Tax=Sporolactobacillus terrae TaxID=269673 RepID=A0A5K7WSM8_9BACL|nr:PIN domain-containing protein [Sporolactobacillus terrae]BBN97485.1 hypothetical protein St703_01900 [Sporolactobacillus terrae]